MALKGELKRYNYGDIGRVPREYRELIEEYCSAIKKHFGERLVSICVFGSVARGEATAESDIDILVVAEGLPFDVGFRTRETNYIHENLKKTPPYHSLKNFGRSGLISDVFFTPDEAERRPPILLDIVEDGVILHDRKDFMANVLKSLKEKLKKMGAKRVITNKGYYWILKPDVKPPEVVKI